MMTGIMATDDLRVLDLVGHLRPKRSKKRFTCFTCVVVAVTVADLNKLEATFLWLIDWEVAVFQGQLGLFYDALLGTRPFDP